MFNIIKELSARRNLILQLVFRDLKIRYSRPALGFFWVFLSPFLAVAVFYLVFSLILKVKIKEAPFAFYLMTAVFTWRFFQDSIISSTTSLIDNKNLIKESNFPHYLVPFSITFTNFIIFLPCLAILAITSLVLKAATILILFLPIIVAVHFIMVFGLSIISSIIYVRFRDIKYILEAALLLLFYLTPAFYSLDFVKESFPPVIFKIYLYNPLTIILSLYRIVFLKGFYGNFQNETGILSIVFIMASFIFIIVVFAAQFYRRNKHSINDYLSY